MEKNSRRAAVTVGVSTAFITSFSSSSLNLAVPDMSEYFHMGAASTGWIVTIYMIIIAGFSAPFGKIADQKGRRRLLLLGTFLFGISSLFCIVSVNKIMLLFLRGLQGIGASMIFATNMPLVMAAYPKEERGMVIGKVTGGTYTGLALGPVIGGVLNQISGWQSIFVFGAVVSFFAFFTALKLLPKDEKGDMGKQDVKGNILYILMITCLIYGLTEINTLSFSWAIILLGIVLVVLFAKAELKADNPVIDVRIFASDKTYTLSNITALFNYSATFGLGYLLSIYLQVAKGYTSMAAGIILIAQPVFMAILTPKAGKLSDKAAPYKLASAGMALCVVTLGFFAFFKVSCSVGTIVVFLCIAGIGTAFFSSPNTNVVMSCVHPSKFGVANSILSTMRTTGQSSGMAIITIVVNGTIGNVSLYDVSAEELMQTMHISFAIFTILCIAGVFMSLSRRKVR